MNIPEPSRPLPSLGVSTDQGLLQWLSSVDHKMIGIMYLLVSLLFFLIGGVLALLMRVQLALPLLHFLGPETYNQFFTMHGTTMIFFVAMPAVFGFSVYFVPLMIGANEMAFPRLNAFGLWLTLFGGLLLYFSFLAGGAPDAGWFNYAPLNENNYSIGPGIDYYAMGLLISGIGSVVTSINLIVTILNYRVKGMALNKLPLFVWMVLVNSFLLLAAFPSLNAALAMLLLDRQFNAHFFNSGHGGSALLWQHLFWIFGHPEVYILILPPFGILSEVFQVFSRKAIFGYPFVAASSVAIALLAFGVWAHHMFAVGLGNTVDSFFSASSMLIGIPTGVKIFNWLATMYGGKIRFTVSMLFAIAFLVEFTIGGLSGIAFSIVPIDWQLTDTYYVVAHIHYVFIGGTVFGLLAGLFYWFPKMTGRLPDERLGKWFFWLFVIGFNLTFLVQHALGMMGMPRRVYTYPALPGYGVLNFISTAGAFLMGASVLLLVYIIHRGLLKGKTAGADPWNAYTLEWATTSPPALKNFDILPAVTGRRPFWDMKQAAHSVQYGTGVIPMQVNQPDNKMMIKLVVGTEAMFFLCLIIAFVYMAFQSGFEPHELNELDIRTTGVYTLLLIASSMTLLFAERCFKKDNMRGHKSWLFITLLLGATFLFGQGREYLRLIRENITLSGSVFGSSFFTLTGFHGLHVFIGLIILSIILLLAFLRDDRRPGVRSSGGAPGVSRSGRALGVAAIYWHFVDIVWIVVFTVVYVLPKFSSI